MEILELAMDRKKATCPEVDLWSAVILRLILDLQDSNSENQKSTQVEYFNNKEYIESIIDDYLNLSDGACEILKKEIKILANKVNVSQRVLRKRKKQYNVKANLRSRERIVEEFNLYSSCIERYNREDNLKSLKEIMEEVGLYYGFQYELRKKLKVYNIEVKEFPLPSPAKGREISRNKIKNSAEKKRNYLSRGGRGGFKRCC